MKTTRLSGIAAVTAIAALALAGCATNEGSTDTTSDSSADTSAELSGTLNGIGSSAQGTAETTWAAGIQGSNPDLTINYDPQGSGAGREAFLGGSADFAGSDAALSDDELAGTAALCADGTTPIDLPVYISPIAIAFNLDGVDELNLDAETIAKIFKGEITTWDDDALTALNPDVDLPSSTINVVHRSDDSGTTQNFTDYLHDTAGDVWDAEAAQTYPYEVGEGAKGTSGVADTTTNTAGSITYIDESGAGDLSIAKLKVGDDFTELSADGAAAVVAASPLVEGRAAGDLAIDIDRTVTDAGAWPLVLVSYIIACQDYTDDDKGALVSAYAQYVATSDAQEAAASEAGSAPLSDALATKVEAAAATIQ
ncbi:MAG: phosphate ABC transporter substrate-binding protein PstS [Microbacterium sp.]